MIGRLLIGAGGAYSLLGLYYLIRYQTTVGPILMALGLIIVGVGYGLS